MNLRPRSIVPQRVRRATAKWFFRRASMLARGRMWSASAATYRQGLAWDPNRAGLWNQYGHALKESGRVAMAIEAYQRAIELEPDRAEFHFQLGLARELGDDVFGAQTCHRRALELEPDHQHAVVAIARIEAKIRQGGASTTNAGYEFPFEEPELV